MRPPAAIVLLMLVSACDERVEEAYPTWSEANRAGAVERGWVPPFVPSTAREISDSHDLDSNRQTLRFTVSPSEVPPMVAGLPRVPNAEMVAELRRKHGFSSVAKAYLVCLRSPKGALVVDHESGRAIYSTEVLGTEAACDQSAVTAEGFPDSVAEPPA